MIREVIFLLSGEEGTLFTLTEDGRFEICSGIADVRMCLSEKELVKPLHKVGANVAYVYSL